MKFSTSTLLKLSLIPLVILLALAPVGASAQTSEFGGWSWWAPQPQAFFPGWWWWWPVPPGGGHHGGGGGGVVNVTCSTATCSYSAQEITGTLTVNSGATATLGAGTWVKGNITVNSGGTLIFNGGIGFGNLTATGASVTLGQGTVIVGNVSITNTPATGVVNLCDSLFWKNVTLTGNSAPVVFGNGNVVLNPPPTCPSNIDHGNVTANNNPGGVTAIFDVIDGTLTVNGNSSGANPTVVESNTVGTGINVVGNTTTTGGVTVSANDLFGDLDVNSTGGPLTVLGNLLVSGNLNVNGDTGGSATSISFDEVASGNETITGISGPLTVTGEDVTGILEVNNNTGGVTVGGAAAGANDNFGTELEVNGNSGGVSVLSNTVEAGVSNVKIYVNNNSGGYTVSGNPVATNGVSIFQCDGNKGTNGIASGQCFSK